MKTCTRCGESKELGLFEVAKRNRNGRGSRCKACVSALTSKWIKENPDKRREQSARDRDSHREQRRAAANERYRHLMDTDPERVRRQRREWAKTPKGIIANRAARHARRGAPLTQESREWWLSLIDPECRYCGEPATEIDHIVPISKGGTGELSNLVPACRSCNASKGDRELDGLGVEVRGDLFARAS